MEASMIFSVKYENGYYMVQSEVTSDIGPVFEEFETEELDEVMDYISEVIEDLDDGSED
jgi:hypothetical protein